MGDAIKMTQEYAKENNVKHWEINTEKGREKIDNYGI